MDIDVITKLFVKKTTKNVWNFTETGCKIHTLSPQSNISEAITKANNLKTLKKILLEEYSSTNT
jgi:hypothetical protein